MSDSGDNEKKLDDLVEALLSRSADPKDDQIAALESKNEEAENRLYEERFTWVLVSIVLIDAYIFTHMANWAGALVIGVLQVIGVVIYADRCKVDTVAPLIDKLTGAMRKATFQGKDGDG